MITYQIVYGYHSSLVTVDEPTKDYQCLIDILIDQLEEKGDTGILLAYTDMLDMIENGEYHSDEYVTGGNHGLLLHHGGNFDIREVHN